MQIDSTKYKNIIFLIIINLLLWELKFRNDSPYFCHFRLGITYECSEARYIRDIPLCGEDY